MATLIKEGIPSRINITGTVGQSDVEDVSEAQAYFEAVRAPFCAPEFVDGTLIIRLGREVDHYPEKILVLPGEKPPVTDPVTVINMTYPGLWNGNE